jgi:hypothetical protein
MVFEFIFDFHDWIGARRAAKWQHKADEYRATMDYWRQIGASLNSFYNGQEKADGPIPGMHEAKRQYDQARRERDRCLAKAAKYRS